MEWGVALFFQCILLDSFSILGHVNVSPIQINKDNSKFKKNWHYFILFHGRVVVHCVYFILSSVDGHLGCFHVLALVNNTAMNTEVHVSF